MPKGYTYSIDIADNPKNNIRIVDNHYIHVTLNARNTSYISSVVIEQQQANLFGKLYFNVNESLPISLIDNIIDNITLSGYAEMIPNTLSTYTIYNLDGKFDIHSDIFSCNVAFDVFIDNQLVIDSNMNKYDIINNEIYSDNSPQIELTPDKNLVISYSSTTGFVSVHNPPLVSHVDSLVSPPPDPPRQ